MNILFSNRIWLLLFGTLLVSGLAASVLVQRIDQKDDHRPLYGILWQLVDSQGHKDYLLGTVHSNDPRILRSADRLVKYILKSEHFVAEIPMTAESRHHFAAAMFIQDESTSLEGLLEPENYRNAIRYLERIGIQRRTANQLKPWAVLVSLIAPTGEGEKVLDQYLFNIAVANQKSVSGLETAAEQVGYFDALEMRIQIEMLNDFLHQYDKYPRLVEQLIQAWLQRDLSAIERLNEKQLNAGNAEVAQLFRQRFIVERNRLMLQRMQSVLQNSDAFIAVGALHLPGPQGLLSLLEKAGYRVTPVY